MGFLPLFDSNILAKQVRSAKKMGAEKIIFLSPAMHSGLLQYTDNLKNLDVEFDIVRTAEDLGQYASNDDDLIFLGDGIFPDDAIEQALSCHKSERIYVVTNADAYENFERIDLTHRWLGVALLKSERLAEISDIPDDWDIGSALLRTAVQAGCERALLSDAKMQSDAVSQLLNIQDSEAFAKRQLGKKNILKQNFLDRFVIWPLMRKLIPLLWNMPHAKSYFGLASLGVAIVALGLLFLNWLGAALGLLLIGSIALTLHDRISIFSSEEGKTAFIGLLFRAHVMVVLTVAVVRASQGELLLGNLTMLLMLLGTLWLAFVQSESRKFDIVMPDFPLVLLTLLIAATFGSFLIGLYLSALYCLAYLLIMQRDRSI